jgi:hypothetical protein
MNTKKVIITAVLTVAASSVFAFNEDLVAVARSYGAENVLGAQTESAPVTIRAQSERVDDLAITAASYGASDVVAGARHPGDDSGRSAQNRNARPVNSGS